MARTSSVVAAVTKAIKAIQDQKSELLEQISALDQQLSEIVKAVGFPSAKVKGLTAGKSPRFKLAKSSKAKSGPYVPEKNSYGALVLAALRDGKEQHRDTIAESVKSAMGSKFKLGSYGQALNKLSNEGLISKVKGKRGFWRS